MPEQEDSGNGRAGALVSTLLRTKDGETDVAVDGDGDGKLIRKAKKKAATHLPGEEGTWIFILGDMTVFALLFGVYITARAEDPGLFNSSQEELKVAFGAVNTLILLLSSLLVVSGIRAMRHGIPNLAPKLFAGAFLCGLAFSVNKIIEYSDKISHDLTPATNDFFMYFFVLTGLHFFHLLIGMALLVFLIVQSRKPKIDERRFAFVEGGACFWHMVDLLWVVLFPLLYLVH